MNGSQQKWNDANDKWNLNLRQHHEGSTIFLLATQDKCAMSALRCRRLVHKLACLACLTLPQGFAFTPSSAPRFFAPPGGWPKTTALQGVGAEQSSWHANPHELKAVQKEYSTAHDQARNFSSALFILSLLDRFLSQSGDGAALR